MQNQWLASLGAEDRARLVPHLSDKTFNRGHVLHEAGEMADAVWFPTQGAISLLTVLDEDKAVETAVVGTEGLVGAASGRAWSMTRTPRRRPTRRGARPRRCLRRCCRRRPSNEPPQCAIHRQL